MLGVLTPDPTDSQEGLYQFQLRPGPGTMCRLAEYDNQWKMLIAPGEIIPSDETLAGTWAWVKVRDHQRLYRTLVEEGFIHHASLIHGDQVEILKLACQFLDVQPVVVD
jgi:L-fucose isomerase-like protein